MLQPLSVALVCCHHLPVHLALEENKEATPASQKATEFITKYNEKNKGLFAKIKQYESGDFIVAICDPLSQRVHEVVPAAGDICFVDATSNITLRQG